MLIRHSFAHLRPVILSVDWSIRRLQSWTCSSLPTVTELVKLTQPIVRNSATVHRLVQRQVQLCNWQFFCGCPSDLHSKGRRVSGNELLGWTAPKWSFVTDKKLRGRKNKSHGELIMISNIHMYYHDYRFVSLHAISQHALLCSIIITN